MKYRPILSLLLGVTSIFASSAFAATASLSTGSSCTYSTVSTDANGNMTITCGGQPPPPPPPPTVLTCGEITSSAGLSFAPGTSVTFGVTCTAPTGQTISYYSWSGAETAGFKPNGGNYAGTFTAEGPVSIGVAVLDTAGTAVFKYLSVNVTKSPPAGTGCPAGSVQRDLGAAYTSALDQVALNGLQAYSVKIRSRSSAESGGVVSLDTNTLGPWRTKYVTISTNPCDFTPPAAGGTVGTSCGSSAFSPSLYYSIGVDAPGQCRLQPGVDYYVNVKHVNPSNPGGPTTCSGACGFSFIIYPGN